MDRTPRGTHSSPSISVVSNSWYGSIVGATQVQNRRRTTWNSMRTAITMFRLSGTHDLVLTTEGAMRPAGLSLLVMLLALARRRNLVLLEFLPGRKSGLGGRLALFAYRRCLHRVCVRVQVMTVWEKDDYSFRYNLPKSVITHLPFYYIDDRIEPPVPHSRAGILSSGKNSCDWETLLDAAEGQNWPLTIICLPADFARINERAERMGIDVKTDVPREEHDLLLENSKLFVLALRENYSSAGHVRLMSALTHKTPLIATEVRGTSGYLELATESAIGGDPLALRTAINRSMNDEDRLSRNFESAYRVGLSRPYSLYEREIREFVLGTRG